jgi:quercetin dioxygenase-like cupin family protein
VYVLLDGELEVLIDGQTSRVGPGAAVYIPAGAIHGYRILSRSARFIVVTAPGGAATFFNDMDAHVKQMPRDMDTLMEVTARNRVTVHAPAPA